MDALELKRLFNLLPYNQDELKKFVAFHARGFEKTQEMIETVAEELALTIFAGMTIEQILESLILIAAQNIQNDTDYDKLATRFLLTKIYKDTLDLNSSNDFKQIYNSAFKNYIRTGIDINLLDQRLGTIFDLEKLSSELMIENDEIFKYIGLSTIDNRYALRDRDQKILETPQFMWMRIAMGMSLNEQNPTDQALVFYRKLSRVEYIPGGSTNIGAGTTFPVLSNCYLLDTEDDTNAIYDNIKNIALISKATGGIGISVTKLRGSGSPVKSNNTMSTGPIPFIKVMDAALKSMSRAGKKYGAMCIYMENWHINFPEFVDLKANAGDDYRRIRTADTAVYISDEFMKRVVNSEEWYMFDPAETPELTELYGAEFSKKYNEYVEKAKRGEMKLFNVVPAREQMKQILNSLMATSHPWLTWKDTINLRALNNNTGTIHCSNLCTEITLPQDRNNIAVCNLAYINLTHHINHNATQKEDLLDWKKLEETVRVIIRHLDNLIDVNASPLPETRNSDSKNRAVGMGMSGFAEVLEFFGYAYDSKEAYDLMDRVSEFISYHSIDESCNLAEERGTYENFKGSLWSKGFVPYDTISKVDRDRKDAFESDSKQNVLDVLKSKINDGIQKSNDQNQKELYEIFSQLTALIENKTQSEVKDEIAKANDLNAAGEGITLRQDKSISMDWDKLRERVKRGVRNATTMAIAPNASTGLVCGTSPGIDPRFAQIFSRNTYSGKFLDINHNLVRNLKQLGIWEQVKGKVLENFGDISEIEEIPQSIKDIYKTSFQISPYAYVEVASRSQKWIDQAISRNMYLETRDVDELVEIYTEAWRRGLKTTYYLHMKPRHTAEQSTVRVNKAEKINKSGFAAVTNAHTTQMPIIEEAKEMKGFGFAAVADSGSNNSNVNVPNSTVSSDVKNTSTPSAGGPVGFGKAASTIGSTENFIKQERKFIDHSACPIDPAERAKCEACQ